MTLVLTELSKAGIAMAADSKITTMNNGKIVERERKYWDKLLRVPKIQAAVSYWGMIGAVTRQQFDTWLKNNVIDTGNYTDLDSFADHLADRLNSACNNKPLINGFDVGIHVAGYHNWSDGCSRPFFYHIHNGHGRFKLNEIMDPSGAVVSIDPVWDSDPRKLFEKHQDFPKAAKSLQENLHDLNISYITRNGDFFIYAVFHEKIISAIQYIHLSPTIRIPRNPNNLASRKGLLHVILESMIRIYGCSSNKGRVVGGKVSSLGIGPNRYVV